VVGLPLLSWPGLGPVAHDFAGENIEPAEVMYVSVEHFPTCHRPQGKPYEIRRKLVPDQIIDP
jgi:hypothetical protein